MSLAHAAQDCTPNLKADERCKTEVLNLHPTQFTIGKIEVDLRTKKIIEMSNDELDDYLEEKRIPVVIGPGGIFYQLDHHHLCAALYQTNIKYKKVYVNIKENWSKFSKEKFWQKMEKENYTYLYKRGEGPLSTDYLPRSIAELTDDPYRSLAYLVRKAGGYEKTSVLYAEFKWADFFRSRISFSSGMTDSDFNKTVAKASELAHSKEASSLPGYTNENSICGKKLLPSF